MAASSAENSGLERLEVETISGWAEIHNVFNTSECFVSIEIKNVILNTALVIISHGRSIWQFLPLAASLATISFEN